MVSVEIAPRGTFSLAASTRFLEGFTPAHYRGGGGGGVQPLRLAFPVEGSWATAGVAVRQQADGTVVASTDGDAPDGLGKQLARVLSLDVDGGGFPEVGRRDSVVARLADAYPGLRPVCFHSPYEAACWAVIGHRIRIVQAAAVKERIAEAYGERRSVDGVELAAFPDPATLHRVAAELPLPEVKRERLRGLAAAALDGRLDGGRLRELEPALAIEELTRLAGIGPFSAELVLVRGAGAPDVFPTEERRLHDSMRQLYDLPGAGVDRLGEVAAQWSPYRSWVALLIRNDREDQTVGHFSWRSGASHGS